MFAYNSFIPPKQIMIRTSYVPFDDILCTIISIKEKHNLYNKKQLILLCLDTMAGVTAYCGKVKG